MIVPFSSMTGHCPYHHENLPCSMCAAIARPHAACDARIAQLEARLARANRTITTQASTVRMGRVKQLETRLFDLEAEVVRLWAALENLLAWHHGDSQMEHPDIDKHYEVDHRCSDCDVIWPCPPAAARAALSPPDSSATGEGR